MEDESKNRMGADTVLSQALHGDINAQFELAGLLLQEQQLEAAGGWCRKAALQGHTEAAYKVGLLCLEGAAAQRADAPYWLHKAAAAGHSGAQYQLGIVYENGYGVQMDPDQSLRWFRQAAANGNQPAKQKIDSLNLFLDQLPPAPTQKKRGTLA